MGISSGVGGMDVFLNYTVRKMNKYLVTCHVLERWTCFTEKSKGKATTVTFKLSIKAKLLYQP